VFPLKQGLVTLLVISILTFSMGSCGKGKSQREETTVQPQTGGVAGGGVGGASAEVPDKESSYKLESTEKQENPITKEQRNESKAFLSFGSLERLLPADFNIGLLQDHRAVRLKEKKILKTTIVFLNGLLKGKIESSLLDTARRHFIDHSLKFYFDKNMIPLSYRIGAIKSDSDVDAIVAIRLFGKTGVTEGDLYLVNTESEWVISDVQVDFQRLAEPYTNKKEFVPSSYDLTFKTIF
jgi:hypothetical protein